MPDISLYRKYRPQNFQNLVGQDHIRATLLNALKHKMVSHAYLFAGPRGTGKTSTARLLAKALNCLNRSSDGEPCQSCAICVEAQTGRLLDIMEIDAASNRGIDEIRDLREKIQFAPNRAAKKVYIIDEVHMLTKEAFNALLKTLEEPPSHAHFILATTEVHKVPETIISRCQRFDFRRIDTAVMTERLQFIAQAENITADSDSLGLIVETAQGGLRDAIGLFEQMVKDKKVIYEEVKQTLGTASNRTIEEFYQLLKLKNTTAALTVLFQLYQEGVNLSQFTRDFLEYLRHKLLNKVAKKSTTVDRVMDMIKIFLNAEQALKNAIIPQLPLEMAVIKCSYEAAKVETRKNISSVDQAGRPDRPVSPVEGKGISARPSGLKTIPLEEKIASAASLPLTLEHVKEQLPRVYERLKKPSVRMSFKQGHLARVDQNVIEIHFRAESHLEKIQQAAHKAEIEQAFLDVFGRPIKLQEQLAKVSLQPELTVTKAEPVSKQEKSNEELMKSAVDIFGGEIIEE